MFIKFIIFFSFLSLTACESPLRDSISIESTSEGLVIEDFSRNDLLNWNVVDDNVMGGRSQGYLSLGDEIAIFRGYLSLQNNGGFSSIRAYVPYDYTNYDTFVLRVKGDGRNYNFRVRADDNSWASYSHSFSTVENDWVVVELNVDDFYPSYRGYSLRNMPELSRVIVREIGVMISDKKEGGFNLEIDWIKIK